MNLALTVAFIIVCVVLTIMVLFQEGNSQGLGTVNGVADTYWGKNKGRSMEGTLALIMRILAALFVILAFLLNIIP